MALAIVAAGSVAAATKPIGTKTIRTSPLTFQGVYAGTRVVHAAPLAFHGLYAGVRTINTSALSFQGTGAALISKGDRK
jgi:hypothetical protein